MVSFESVEELETLLDQFIERDEPLLVRIPRAAGQREDRYAHLLCGEPDIEIPAKVPAVTSGGSSIESDRITQLEEQVAELKSELKQLWELTGLTKG